VLDAGAASQFGASLDLGDGRARWQALVDQANAAGGVNGRKIVPAYRTIDLLGGVEAFQAACVGWTADDHVFSVLVSGTMPVETAVCLTGQGGTPLFTGEGYSSEYYANGRLYSLYPSNQRVLVDQAHDLIRTGALKGRTIGIASSDGLDLATVRSTLVPELERAGYQIKRIEVLPGDTSATQRMSVAISNFKAAGVDFLIMGVESALVAPFAQAADRSNFRPTYSVSEFNLQINDALSSYMPDSFDGTKGLSVSSFPAYNAGQALSEPDASCQRTVGAADPKAKQRGTLAWGVANFECGVFQAWLTAARNAGRSLSSASLAAGAERITSFSPAGALSGSFAPGKHDAVDFVRDVEWSLSCRCWRLTAGSTPRPLG
jgi:hypothetical protein